MTINMNEIKRIYPNKLPEAHIFFATSAIAAQGITYSTIRSHVKYRTTNRGAWLRFIEAYKELPPANRDNNTESVKLTLGPFNDKTYWDPITKILHVEEDAQINFSALAKLYDSFQAAWDATGIEPQVWEHIVVVNGQPVPVHHPDPLGTSLAVQMFKEGHPFDITLKDIIGAGETCFVQVRVNGTTSDAVTVLVSDGFNVQDPYLHPFELEDPVYAADGIGFDEVFRIIVTVPKGSETEYTWALKSSPEANHAQSIIRGPEVSTDPATGDGILVYTVYPVGNWAGADTDFWLEGTPGPNGGPPMHTSKRTLKVVGIPDDFHIELASLSEQQADFLHLKDVVPGVEPQVAIPGLRRFATSDLSNLEEPVAIIKFMRSGLPRKAFNRLKDDPRGPRFHYKSESPAFIRVLPEYTSESITNRSVGARVSMHANGYSAASQKITITDVSSDLPEDKRAKPLTMYIKVSDFQPVGQPFEVPTSRWPLNEGTYIRRVGPEEYEWFTNGAYTKVNEYGSEMPCVEISGRSVSYNPTGIRTHIDAYDIHTTNSISIKVNGTTYTGIPGPTVQLLPGDKGTWAFTLPSGRYLPNKAPLKIGDKVTVSFYVWSRRGASIGGGSGSLTSCEVNLTIIG